MMIAGAKSLTYAAEIFQPGRLPSLWIRTAAGPRMGFGHLRRSLVIAEALRDCCRTLFLLDPDDVWSRQHLEEQSFDFYSVGMETAWDSFPDPAAILIDTRLPGGLSSLITRARVRCIPIVSIHDMGLNMLPSDTVIDGSVVPLNSKAAYPGTKVFAGADYMVLDPIYRILYLQNKPVREHIRSVVINLGGGNSGKYYWKVLKGLKLWNREIDVIGVPGFVSWGQEVFAQSDWKPLHFRWEKRNFERLLFEADLAITAGGIAAYEALCTGTPLLALSYDRFQKATVRRLKRSGACMDLGLGEELVPDALAGTLSDIDADIALRKRLSANGKKIVDGQGVERVAQILRESMSNGDRHHYKAQSA
jgi:spore coat polysaccharide biosynthesis predicted glycosyltransferase SpsG